MNLNRRLDQQEITDVLYRRARSMNRADPELAHACYHIGATERHGPFVGLAADFIDKASFSRPNPDAPLRATFHIISNVLVSFSSLEVAQVESYHVVWRFTEGTHAAIGGRYLDRFEKVAGQWAIRHRDVVFDWSRLDLETENFWEKHPAAPDLFGQRGPSDPLYLYTERGAPQTS